MKRLLLVRHGESVWNAEGRIQGQECGGLSDRGRAQAEALALALARSQSTPTLVSSDLPRAWQTAVPIADALGRPLARDPALRERDFGGWQGRLRDEVAASEPSRWARWCAGEDVVIEVGGESTAQVASRAAGALRRLVENTPQGGTTIVVTHGGPIWQGTHGLLGIGVGVLGGIGNASITTLAIVDDGSVILERFNEQGHLTDEPPVEDVMRAGDASGPVVGA